MNYVEIYAFGKMHNLIKMLILCLGFHLLLKSFEICCKHFFQKGNLMNLNYKNYKLFL